MTPAPYQALVLAGGSARRFGGEDKGLQRLDGKPFVEHTLAALAAQTAPPASCLISANRNLDVYRAFGHPVLADSRSGFQGPLAGIAEGLAALSENWLLVVPCDVVALPADFAERLFAEADHADAVCACDAESMHPALLLVNRRVRAPLDEFLLGDNRRLRDWLASLALREAFFPAPFPNLNSPESLRQWQSRL
ncbi:molybdenum cofactor guanylyltransferase MobA [Crenobacter cavernae]|uniref:Molybdenum cofactor guanylyltransferase n=1 Tax=Crenobacter cavernae TaxID=2290923 RepID=A0A345Y4P8_9NEIS|nr:molybdenum cofactor guanylyltransferase MobA [Crenobacter cavernae]AXK38900.1 molybdenum cofactor guanylyltransferase [Crenobacter cavernae]